MRLYNHFHKQSGTAIFMALLVVTIVTAISVVWFMQTRANVRRTQQMLLSEQIYLYAEGVVDWGIGALKIDTTTPKILPPTIMTNQGLISGHIDDYQKKDPSGADAKLSMASETKEYFILKTNVQLANQHLILYSLLHRTIIDGKVQIGIIWQSRGTA